MSDIEFDFSDLQALSADLGQAGYRGARNAQKVVEVTARGIKDQAKSLAGGIGHAPHYPRSITYDMQFGLQQTSAEIGPDKGGPQGALGNILEYGTSKNAPIPHLGPALKANEADFIDGLSKAIGDVL